jgi:hypothetical protein
MGFYGLVAASAVICVSLLTISYMSELSHSNAILGKYEEIGSFIRMEAINAQDWNSSVMRYMAGLNNAYYSSNHNYSILGINSYEYAVHEK